MSSYVVMDLEMCNVPKECRTSAFWWKNEMIQIGAVLMNEDYEIVDEFKSFVHPEFGMIDPFIENLTGISQCDVDDAPCAADALTKFTAWLPDDAYVVSWSESDPIQIERELDAKEIDLPELDWYLDEWLDCQAMFGERMNSNRNYKLSEALNIAGIAAEAGEHDALVDARNTAMLFAKLEQEDDLQLAPAYVSAEATYSVHTPFAKLLAGFRCAAG